MIGTRRRREAAVELPEGRRIVPRCSVVIPVHNKASLTKQCLDSILANPPHTAFEVVVVDDASSDATPQVLADLGDKVRCVRLTQNSGFATACNAGAKAALSDEFVLFLNNDTIACPGWLDALIEYADRHPEAAVVGSKLLYPDGTIQHAGVVFNIAGDPLHIYVGCPGDHPAVNTSRRFQVVTGACFLIRRTLFERIDGFDAAYQNDLEDVDLCLRLGSLGHEIHYCHESELYHLESASRGRSTGSGRSAHVYRERWGSRVRHDELDYYLADGFLDLLRISPDRLTLDGSQRSADADVLQVRSRQFLELLRETVRVSTCAAPNVLRPDDADVSAGSQRFVVPLRVRKQLQSRIRALREDLSGSLGHPAPGEAGAAVAAPADALSEQTASAVAASPDALSEQTPYDLVQADVRATVERCTEAGSTVLVVSKGDDELVRFSGRTGWHFPRAADGRYAGYYPTDGSEAVGHLERLRAQGASFIVFPETAWWWLEHYPELARQLDENYGVTERTAACLVFDLRVGRLGAPAGEREEEEHHGEETPKEEHEPSAPAMPPVVVRDAAAEVVKALVPGDARVAVGTTDSTRVASLSLEGVVSMPLGEDAATEAAVEELARSGLRFLVLPKATFSWLADHPSFAAYLREEHRLVIRQRHACEIHELLGCERRAGRGRDADA
jgi:GT2 family glycosyltransferase